MRLKFFLLIMNCGFLTAAYSQSGSVSIHKDARLDQKITDLGIVIPPNPTPQIDGYRIQLAFEQSRDAIDEAKMKFTNLYPDIDCYTIYKAPNFFLKAGDFRTSLEAEKVKNSIESLFPTSNVIREKINLPKIK